MFYIYLIIVIYIDLIVVFNCFENIDLLMFVLMFCR